MGGAVSSGRDNNELIDNLMSGNYIRTRCVERVFRALDRADYMTPESRDQAYKDLAWRNGALHISSPCIYSEVMEGLELKPGLSFLNVGSGTGYLSTLAGLILGSSGISHGIEVHSSVVEYANKKLGLFIANSPTLDEFDFCEPKFYVGNGLSLRPQHQPYDRVYCGASCPAEYENYFKQLIKVGGVLVMPINDTLQQVKRLSAQQWVTRTLLNVSFATLRVPSKGAEIDFIKLDEQAPPRLQVRARAAVRAGMRRGVLRRHPELREPEPRRAPPPACPRRICIPIETGGGVDDLNILHDLDADTGANEMNALLSLVIRMDQNRVAGAIRFDDVDITSDEEEARPNRTLDLEEVDPNEPMPRRMPRTPPREIPGVGSGPGRTGSTDWLPRNTRRPDRSEGGGEGSRDRNRRWWDRSSNNDDASRNNRGGRRGRDDDDSKKTEKFRRLGPPGRLLAFEFQAAERSASATSSAARAAARNAAGDKKTSTASDRAADAAADKGPDAASDKQKDGVSDKATDTAVDRAADAASDAGSDLESDAASDKGADGGTDRDSESATTSSASSDDDDDSSNDLTDWEQVCCDCDANNCGEDGEIPSEVELCFRNDKVGMSRPGPSLDMGLLQSIDWEDCKNEIEELRQSYEDQRAGSCKSESKAKRQKLDSGIGENTPSGSSPDKRKTEESEPEEEPVRASDAADAARPAGSSGGGRRRGHKRSRVEKRASSSSAEEGAAEGGTEGAAEGGTEGAAEGAAEGTSAGAAAGAAAGAGGRRRVPRRARGRGVDARRVRLSIVMKRAIKELPLPYALKKYVNLGRCFEF